MQTSYGCPHRARTIVAFACVLAVGATAVFAHVDYVETERIQLREPHPDQAAVEAAFAQAADRYGVPVEILKAVGFVESRWEHTGPTVDRGYGIMHLVSNSDAATLGEAAELTGLSIEDLKLDPFANIKGGAALIAHYVKKTVGTANTWLDYREALKRFSGLNESVQDKQVLEYFNVLANGASGSNVLGMNIQLAPVTELDLTVMRAEIRDREVASDDYGPAIWNPAASCNYETTRYGTAIDHWINHWIGSGSYAGTISWFKNCAAETSSHFVIRQSDGEITQMVRIAHRAWTTGNMNSRSIGIEHEATPSYPWPQDINAPMIVSSATACRHFCNVYGIPKTRSYITGHNDYYATACPGNLPWDVYLARVNNSPPAVTGNPSGQNVCQGANVQFGASASGYGVTYKWQRNGGDINDGGKFSGTGGGTLTISSVDSSVAGNYRCRFTNFAGTVYSSQVTLTVRAATTATQHPAPQSVCEGTPVVLSAAGTGEGAVSYRWQRNGSNLSDGGSYSGTGSSTLTLSPTDASLSGTYRCVITGGCGSVNTNNAAVVVGTTTAVTSPPAPQTICEGNSTSLEVGINGTNLTYQWQKDEQDISEGGAYTGTQSATLNVAQAVPALSGLYRCVVAGMCGNTTTSEAQFTVLAATVITQQPTDQITCSGTTATFTVAATGDEPITYQWQKDGVDLVDGGNISGALTPSLQVFNADAPDVADYRCVVTASCGAQTSDAAKLILWASTAITRDVEPVIAPANTTAHISVAAIGAAVSFQWSKDSMPLVDDARHGGTTTPVLTIMHLAPEDEGQYSCQVSGPCGTQVSSAASLTLGTGTPADAGPTYLLGPWDINGGGGYATAGEYAAWSSSAQNGGTGDIAEAPYAFNDGFWPPVFAAIPVATVPSDFNGDGDVDGHDVGHMAGCFTGDKLGPPPPGCEDTDLDGDNDTDQDDYGILQLCLSGFNIPADPTCAP